MITVSSQKGGAWVVCKGCGRRGPRVDVSHQYQCVGFATAKIRALESGWEVIEGHTKEFPVLVCRKCKDEAE